MAGPHVGVEQAAAVEIGVLPALVIHVLWHRLRVEIEGGSRGWIRERHAVDPALAAVRAEDEPVDAVAPEQLDLIALVQDADFPGPKLVGHVEEADQAVANAAALAVLDRRNLRGLEREVRRLLRIPQRIRSTYLLQGRPAPARHQRLVDGQRAWRGFGLVAAVCRGLGLRLTGLAVVAALLPEEREGGQRRGMAGRRPGRASQHDQRQR